MHDVGVGCGVGASCLPTTLEARGESSEHITLPDPTATNLSVAANALNSATYSQTTFAFKQVNGEEEFLEPGTLDMISACESLHWTDAPVALKNVYTCLRTGGTFAAVFYHIYPSIRDNARARAERAFRKRPKSICSLCIERIAR